MQHKTPGLQRGTAFGPQRIDPRLAHEQVAVRQGNAIARECIFFQLVNEQHSVRIGLGYGGWYRFIDKCFCMNNAGSARQNTHDHIRVVLLRLQIELKSQFQPERAVHGPGPRIIHPIRHTAKSDAAGTVHDERSG